MTGTTKGQRRAGKVYSPKVPEEYIPALYHLGQERQEPMTQLVARAIAEFLDREQAPDDPKEAGHEGR